MCKALNNSVIPHQINSGYTISEYNEIWYVGCRYRYKKSKLKKLLSQQV